MNFVRRNKGKIFTVFVIFLLLLTAYFLSGDKSNTEPDYTEEFAELYQEHGEETEKEEITKEELPPEQEKQDTAEKEPPETGGEEKSELFCTLCVRCDTIFANISQFDERKLDILPKDGVIFAEKKAEFTDGESVFDLLLREMKNNKIHLEFVNTPVYGSVYIEGIGNIYEFDAGELSGWMYKVNGEFPNFGCSKYILKQGDRVEFVYTCDLGKDVGGGYVKGQGAYDE